jgi:hypothetical protein
MFQRRKGAKMQWLQNLSQMSGDTLHNVIVKLVGISGTKRGNIWKTMLVSLQHTEQHSRLTQRNKWIEERLWTQNKLCKWWEWQSHNIQTRWKNYFSWLLNDICLFHGRCLATCLQYQISMWYVRKLRAECIRMIISSIQFWTFVFSPSVKIHQN